MIWRQICRDEEKAGAVHVTLRWVHRWVPVKEVVNEYM